MTKVSIIIPVYNTALYLKRCLESVCNQTLSDIEVICINDCSTDNSLEILQQYNVKIIDLKENKGAAYARNIGIKHATGEYIGFVDSDDFIEKDFYEKLYLKAKITNADAVKGNIYNYIPETGKNYISNFYNMNSRIKINKAYFCYAFTSAIYKTNIIKSKKIFFPENISFFEDPFFSINFGINSNTIKIVDNAVYYYTIHQDSSCFNCKNIKSANDFIKSLIKITNTLNQSKVNKNDYLIYINFLLEQVIPWCGLKFTDEINNIALDGVLYILNNCKYSQKELLSYYFFNKKKNEQQLMLKNLRNKILTEKTNA